MSHTIFKKLPAKESQTILKAINDNSDLSDFKMDQTVIMGQGLIFYPEYKLLDIADKTIIPEKQLYVVYKSAKEFQILDFSNQSIYKTNKVAPLQLDAGSVCDYVQFFFNFARGEHGRFILTETLDDIKWQDEPPLNARKAISKLLIPLTVVECKKDKYILKATYLFLDTLIQSQIIVDAKGMITIEDEEILIEDMPVIHEDME